MRYRTSSYMLVLLAAVVLAPAAARAQSVGLAPAQIEQKFKPGVPFQFDLATANNGTSPVEMDVQITDLWYDENNQKVFSSPGTSPRSAANWIQFVPEHFEVPGSATQKMKAIVTPPADAKGGYYAVLFVKSKPVPSFNDSKEAKTVFTNMRIGCLVLLRAEGTEDFKIQISNTKLVPPTANQGLTLDFDVANTGNTHVFPLARLAVLDANHKLVAKAESEVKRFLPGQKNSLHVEWTGNLVPGNYTAVLSVTYGDDRVETLQMPFKAEGQ